MGMALRLLRMMKKRLVITIPIAMALGLVTGSLFDTSALKVLVLPMTILMIYPMMVALNLKSVFSKCSVPLQASTQALNFIFMPLLAFGIGKLLLPDKPLYALGLLLIGLIPTSGMTISWTGFAKGNVTVAIKMTVIGLIAGSVLTPVFAKLFMGTVVDVPLLRTFKQIALVIFVPLVLGYATQWALVRHYGAERFKTKIKPRFPLLSTLGVVGIVFLAMSLKARAIVADPAAVAWLLVPLTLFYLSAYAAATLVGRLFFERKDAIALVYGSVMRNLSIALAIALIVFGEDGGADIALIIATAFIVQAQSAAWYLKLSDRLLGAAPAATAPQPG